MKVAIVGCGKIADGHVEQIQTMPHLGEVIAVCDLEPLMAEQLAFRYQIPRHYTDFDKLLEREQPDVVHITTPPASHLSLATTALDAGCHIYVEKPLTLHPRDAPGLVKQAQRAGRKLCVGYTYMFDPPALAMRELIASGAIGDVLHVESFYGYNLAGQYGSAILADSGNWVHRLPGGLLQNNISHLLNKIVELCDDESLDVKALGYRHRERLYGDVRDDMLDELRLMINGDRFTAFGTFSSHIRPAAHMCRVYGTKNTVHLDFLARTVTLDAGASLPSAIGRLVPAFEQAYRYAAEGLRNVACFARSEFHFFSGLARLIQLFYESILNGTEPPISTRDVLLISTLLDDIFSQLKPQEQP